MGAGCPARRAVIRFRRARPLAAVGVAVAVAVGISGCPAPTPSRTTLRIATGSAKAVYYAFGQSLAGILNRELPGVTASVVVTAASAENVALIADGRAELGFTQADILPSEPLTATDLPTGPSTARRLTAVARVYDDLLHLVTRADGSVRQLADLRNRPVSVGAPGSGTAVTANRLLNVAGLGGGVVRVQQLGLDASVAALRAGEIDAFFFSGGLPVKAVADFVAGTPCRFIDLAEWVEPLRRTFSEVYVGRDIPTSAYGVPAVTTVAVPNYLVVNADLPEDLVFEITRLLMQRRNELGGAHPAAARLNAQSAITTAPLPLHPGAARYYRSVKP